MISLINQYSQITISNYQPIVRVHQISHFQSMIFIFIDVSNVDQCIININTVYIDSLVVTYLENEFLETIYFVGVEWFFMG